MFGGEGGLKKSGQVGKRVVRRERAKSMEESGRGGVSVGG